MEEKNGYKKLHTKLPQQEKKNTFYDSEVKGREGSGNRGSFESDQCKSLSVGWLAA